jgi:hypothetical protein
MGRWDWAVGVANRGPYPASREGGIIVAYQTIKSDKPHKNSPIQRSPTWRSVRFRPCSARSAFTLSSRFNAASNSLEDQRRDGTAIDLRRVRNAPTPAPTPVRPVLRRSRGNPRQGAGAGGPRGVRAPQAVAPGSCRASRPGGGRGGRRRRSARPSVASGSRLSSCAPALASGLRRSPDCRHAGVGRSAGRHASFSERRGVRQDCGRRNRSREHAEKALGGRPRSGQGTGRRLGCRDRSVPARCGAGRGRGEARLQLVHGLASARTNPEGRASPGACPGGGPGAAVASAHSAPSPPGRAEEPCGRGPSDSRGSEDGRRPGRRRRPDPDVPGGAARARRSSRVRCARTGPLAHGRPTTPGARATDRRGQGGRPDGAPGRRGASPAREAADSSRRRGADGPRPGRSHADDGRNPRRASGHRAGARATLKARPCGR